MAQATVILLAVGVLAWLAVRSMALAVVQLVIGLALVAVISLMTALRVPWLDVDSEILPLNPYFVATAALALTAAGVTGAAVHARRRWSRRSTPNADAARLP